MPEFLAIARAAPQAVRAVLSIARSATTHNPFGALSVRHYAPCRYDDPHVSAYKILKQGQLDHHAFPDWQSLVNFFVTNQDEPAAIRARTLARNDSQNPTVGYIPSCVQVNDERSIKFRDLDPTEKEAAQRFFLMAREAQDAVLTGKLNDTFPTWGHLRQYFYETDDFRSWAKVNEHIEFNVKASEKTHIDPAKERESAIAHARSEFIQAYMKEYKATIADAIKAWRVSQGNDRMA